MLLDTHDYYPYTPGSGCDPDSPSDEKSEVQASTADSEPWQPSGQSDASLPSESPEPAESQSCKPTESNHASPAQNPQHSAASPGFVTTISHILSWVLSPVLLPTYGIIAVFALSMLSYAPARSKWIIVGIVFGLTCLIPCIAVWILTKFGDVSDVALSRRTDRTIPYIITAASLLGCGLYLNVVGMPEWVGYFYIGAAIASIINLLINFKWKISAHSAGIGGFVAIFLVLNRYGVPPYNLWVWCIVAIALGGMLGAARVWLGRHTAMQTIAGETVGFLSVIIPELLLVPPI